LLFLSGQIGLDPASGELGGGGVEGQARQAMENLGAVLRAAGLELGAVVKTTIYLGDMADFGAVNQIYADFFEGVQALPARACVAVAGLPKGALVEVEAVARR
jgi:2-iminobutanoate/2-iminopropanoate deaminase